MPPAVVRSSKLAATLLVGLSAISMASALVVHRLFALLSDGGYGVFEGYGTFTLVAVCTLLWLVLYRYVARSASPPQRPRLWLLLLPFVTCYPAWLIIWIVDGILNPHRPYP